MFRSAAIVTQINSLLDGYEKTTRKFRLKLSARPVTERASRRLSNQQSRAEKSTLPPAKNVLARAELESRVQTVTNPLTNPRRLLL